MSIFVLFVYVFYFLKYILRTSRANNIRFCAQVSHLIIYSKCTSIFYKTIRQKYNDEINIITTAHTFSEMTWIRVVRISDQHIMWVDVCAVSLDVFRR